MLIHFGEASSIFKQKCPTLSKFYTNFKQRLYLQVGRYGVVGKITDGSDQYNQIHGYISDEILQEIMNMPKLEFLPGCLL